MEHLNPYFMVKQQIAERGLELQGVAEGVRAPKEHISEVYLTASGLEACHRWVHGSWTH